MTRRRLRTTIAAPVALAAILAASIGLAAPAAADHQVDDGYLTNGYATEDQAMSTPCPAEEAGSWSTVGAVVCFPKLADQWAVEWVNPPGAGCSYYPNTGWTGTCVWAADRGDHVKVWASQGVTYERFRLTWLHDAGGSGSGDGSSSGSAGGDDGDGFEEPEASSGDDGWDPGLDPGSSGSGSTGEPAPIGSPGKVSGASTGSGAPGAPGADVSATGDADPGDGVGDEAMAAATGASAEESASAAATTSTSDGSGAAPVLIALALAGAGSGGAIAWYRRRAARAA